MGCGRLLMAVALLLMLDCISPSIQRKVYSSFQPKLILTAFSG